MGVLDRLASFLDINISKSVTTGVVPISQPVSETVDMVKSAPAGDRISLEEAPWSLQLLGAMGYKDKPSNLTYQTLYQMSVKNSVVAAVLGTRINQVSNFTKPSRYSMDKTGYEIRMRDPEQKPTDEQKAIMIALETFLENCGYHNDNERDDFDTFIRKIVRDSLTYDQMTFEIVRDKAGRPAELLAVDAATIRAVTEESRHNEQDEDLRYVQIVDGMIQASFTNRDLAFCVRNPRSSIFMAPYGFSELEQLIHQITSHLYAEEYNSRFFSQGGTTKGIINLKTTGDTGGVANTSQLESFKRQWQAQVSGLTGAWKTPVVQMPGGIEYVNVSQSNREMEFEQWMNYLINIVCAIYQIDPAEVNFPNRGGAGGHAGSALGGESSMESKLKHSKDKGLRPLLRFLETCINKHIISQFSQDFVFNFVGLDTRTEDEIADLVGKEVKVFKTVNEARKERGMAEIENGDVILDSSWMNYTMQMAMAAQGGAPNGAQPENEEQPTDMNGEQSDVESDELDYDKMYAEDVSGGEDNGENTSADEPIEKAYTLEIFL